MENKVCKDCNKEKLITEFYFRKDKNIYRRECKECWAKKSKQLRSKIKKANENVDPYTINKTKHCHSCDKEKAAIEFHKNANRRTGLSDECIECDKTYKQNNRDTINKRLKERYDTEPANKISRLLRNRLHDALRQQQKTGSAVKDLGCSVEELEIYLEKKFYPHPITGENMTWDNYSRDGWHIDHIYPLSKFDLSDPEQIKKACHYTNLQPLWAKDNLSKGDKI